MSQVSRPVQIALAATLLFALLWFVALRPKPADGDGAPAPEPAPAAQQAPEPAGAAPPADRVAAATPAAGDADASAGRAAATANDRSATDRSATDRSAAEPAGAARRATPRERATAAGSVRTALRQRKALALAFVDPRTADARAVREELRHVSRFGGRAVVVAVPIAQLSRYEFITREVQVTVAPTVVIVSPRRTATTIVGFADRGEIEQGLADALAVR